MKKHTNYMILPEFNLILECCKGQATVEDSIQMKKDELKDDLYNSDYNIIVDFQDFEQSIDSSVFGSISDFFAFLLEIETKSKIAMLTREPVQVVASMLLKKLSIESGTMKIEVFSTVEAALTYLGFRVEALIAITDKIKELNKKTV